MTDPLTWQAPRIKSDPEESPKGLRARILLLEAENRNLKARISDLELREDTQESERDLAADFLKHGQVILENQPNGKHYIT